MKKSTFSKIVFIALLLFMGLEAYAQNFVPFTTEFNQTLKGDIRLIGNNILGPHKTNAYNGANYNHLENMVYVDIDNDNSTFNSSSADLEIPNNGCYRIVHAGLYWGAVNRGTESITDIKFKGPVGAYNNIKGKVIYDAKTTVTGNSLPYACYADVTSIVASLGTNLGTYTIGNVSTAQGKTNNNRPVNTTGHSAGWSLFIVFEDPTLPGKYITSFDGFSSINASVAALDIPISGFQTPPAPIPVTAKFAFAALEGDQPIKGDKLRINGTLMSTPDRPNNNFFNSSVTKLGGGLVTNRNPNSTNTLGFDTGIMDVPNPSKTVIGNGDTSATIRMESTQDQYFAYFIAFAVDVIQPKIVLTKVVEDEAGNEIGGAVVDLGQKLTYVIGFQNKGNDDAKDMYIRDVLPININFNYPADLISLPPSVTSHTYNPLTRELIFNINKNYIKKNTSPLSEIRIGVQVVESCNQLSDMCSNIIQNQAFTTYKGVENPGFQSTDDPSVDTNTFCLLVPQATNFLADLSDCIFTQNATLCTDSVELTAANGYNKYKWSTDAAGNNVIGTTQTITVSKVGTYYVHNTAVAPCQNIDQIFTVTNFVGATLINPVIAFADISTECTDDGELLPKIFLCGANDNRLIDTKITDTSSIIWEKLVEGSCTTNSGSDDCANSDGSCKWSEVSRGPIFDAKQPGQFRLTLNYTGGCFNQYYFNVYQNELNPTAEASDIICDTKGKITIGGVPSGYLYSIDNVNFFSSNVFEIATPGFYTAYIKQDGVATNPCIFTVPDVQIREREFSVISTVNQPRCNGDKGNIYVEARDARGQYTFTLSQNGTQVNTSGLSTENFYTFLNLNPGTYTVLVKTQDGCEDTRIVEIIEPTKLTANLNSSPITCEDGEITISAQGGTPPYYYFVNGSNEVNQFTDEVKYPVTAAGTYEVKIVDTNDCVVTKSIIVSAIAPPSFTATTTNILCGDQKSGTIKFNVSNANGNTLKYSIDNGVNFKNTSTFSGLTAGDYDVVVEYSIGTSVCLTVPQKVTILPNVPLEGVATLSTPYTCTTNGTITVSGVSGGTGPYTYSIDGVNFQSGNVFSNLTNGVYTLTVKDALDCAQAKNTIIIAPLNPPTNLSFNNTALTCPSNSSKVTITETIGGTGILQYRIIAPAAAATAYTTSTSFSDLASGTYTFEVKDENNCTYKESYTINGLPTIKVVAQPLKDVTCFGASDGSIRFTVTGTSNFNYKVNGGTSIPGTDPIVLTGLPSGNYTILITDATTNCTATVSTKIEAPAALLSVSATVSPLTCNANGSVVINATGGWGSNIYRLKLPNGTLLPEQGTNVFGNLNVIGKYTATVKDAKGCSVSVDFNITTPIAPKAEIKVSNDCYDPVNGSTIEVTATDGKTPYEYSMNGGAFSATNVFTGLTPGSYIFSVRDAYGCAVTLPAEIIKDQLLLTTKLTKELDCTLSSDAIIKGTFSGGYAPYTYAVSINGSAYTSFIATGSPFTYATANAGSYQFKITDAKGCTALSEVTTIDPIVKPTATTTVVNASCNGDNDGSFQIIPSGGVGPYTYSFNGSSFNSTSSYSGLSAGVYTYRVRDSKACIYEGSVEIKQPSALIVGASATTLSCNVDNTAQAAVVTIAVPTTGTAPYTYSFNGSAYSATNTLTVNDNGSTQIVNYSVKDANGCAKGDSITIARLNAPTDLTFNATTITCDATTSTVTLTAVNGVGILQYETIAPSPVIIGKQTSNVLAGLEAGTYIFKVTDANGCYYTESLTIAPVTNIAVAGLKLSDVFCFGGNNGTAQFTVSGYAGNYTAVLTSGTGTLTQSVDKINLTNLVAGNYTVQVTDTATKCTATETIEIKQPINALALTATATNVHCKNYQSQITTITTGGTLNYTYVAVTTGSPVPNASAYKAGSPITVDTNSGNNLNWDVYVKDANGCTAKTSITILADALPSVTSPTVSNQCTANSGFTFTAIGTGVAPLRYSINGGASYQDNGTFTVNTAGSYTITVIDANGCTATSAMATEVFAPITVSASLTQDLSCFTISDASINITASGGKAPYTYEVSFNGNTYASISGSPYTATASGNYQFKITDANGCPKETAIVTVNPAIQPEITSVVVAQEINCSGDETGALTITVDISKGLAPFVINVKNTITGIDYGTQTSGLAAGDYIITVTDAKGCADTQTITITEPLPIIVTHHSEPITCDPINGISKGSVIIDGVTGGTGPYNYFVTGTNGYAAQELNNAGTMSVTFNVVDFGLYQINVVDFNGCSVLVQNVLVASPPDDLDIAIAATADCINGGQAVVSIGTTLAGAGPFFFSIYEGPTTVYPNPVGSWQPEDAPGSKTTTFTNLTSGVTYTFIVYDDSTGCSYYETAPGPIPTNSTLTASSVNPNNITCKGSANGNVTFQIKSVYGTDTAVTFEIFNSQSLISTGITGVGNVPANGILSVSNLGPLNYGNYYVLIKENSGPNAGCSVVTIPFNITESSIDLSITAKVSKNENCNALGVISATASFGTGPYTYQVVAQGATPDATAWYTPNTFQLVASTYDVYVRDAYGCEKSDTITLIKDDEPTINLVPQQCFDGSALNITLTGTTFDGTATYSIGGVYQSSPDFTITANGSYTISIKDSNGCIDTKTFVVEPPLLLNADLTLDLNCDLDARIDLTAIGGIGAYTFEVSDDAGLHYIPVVSLPFEPSVDGTYTFRVTDSQGCEAISNAIVVTPKTTPTFAFSTQINASCNGVADGSFIVTASNGIAPYRYSIDGFVTFQTSNLFEGLGAGTYTITVKDSKNCDSATDTITITEPDLVTGIGVLTVGLACGAENATQPATVTITGAGGTGPYTYSFDGINFTTVNTYKTFIAGTITAYVKDANNCAVSAKIEVVVPALSVPTDLDFVATKVTCLDLTSDVTLTATNGVGSLTYEIISPASATTNTTGVTTGIFLGLLPDTYTFTVTDVNGCYYTEAYTITPVTNITVSGSLDKDVACIGESNGEVTFTVAKFADTYSYQFDGGTVVVGQTNPTITQGGLAAGDHTIIVTDETTGCTASSIVTVNEPTAVVLNLISNVNAYCDFGAVVTVEASGGIAPYKYAFVVDGSAPLLSDYTSSNTSVLDPVMGTEWDVWVMDNNGCNTTKIDVAIILDPLPTVDVPTFAINQCTVGSGFEFTVTNPQGIAPFTYSIGNGFQSSPTFTVSAPGLYSVTMKDGHGCLVTMPASIEVYPALGITASITALPSCDDNDGVITVTATGGSGLYIYAISPNLAGITITGNVFSGVPAGNYTITITDTTTSCTEDVSVTLDAPTPVDFTTTATNVKCFGDDNGTITVNLPASNDNPIYTYEITAGPMVRTAQNSNVFTGLIAGTYTVQVNSGRGCFNTSTVEITQPIALSASGVATDFACAIDNSVNTSEVTITGFDGTPSYTYSIDGINYFTTNTFDVIDNGTTQIITVYVLDANGCLATNTVTILPLPELTLALVAIAAPIDCNGTGLVRIDVTGGSGNFLYELLPSGVPQASNEFSITEPGDYYFQVTDIETGCSIETLAFTVDPFDVIDVEATATTAVTCFGDANGALEIYVSNYTGNYTYEVLDSTGATVIPATAANTSTNPQLINGLSGGSYTIVVTETDSPFCATITNRVTIASPADPLALIALETANVTCDNNIGTITAQASGGWGTYEYELTGAASVPYSPNGQFEGLSAGVYIINARDAEGCEVSTSVTLDEPTPITATFAASATTLSCFGDDNGSITVTNVTGGQGSNYTYVLNTVLPTPSVSGSQTSPVFNGLVAGTYNVTITDGYNCSETSANIVIAQPTQIKASLVTATTATCLTQSALTLSATGGTGNYEYSTTDTFATVLGSFAASITFDVPVGTYKYYVRDANGCIAVVSNSIKVEPVPTLVLNVDARNATIKCFGDETGVIVAIAQGGLGNYIYTLQDASGNAIPGAVQETPGVFTELKAGSYFVRVDSGDCDTKTARIEITEPAAPLEVTYDVFDVTCFGSKNGSIVINATGGTGLITYAISPQLNQFFTKNIFEDLKPGDYTVIVNDANGCFEIIDFKIGEPTAVTVSVVPNSKSPEICYGDNDGAFSITIAGGTAPYSVSLDDISGPYTAGVLELTPFDFTGLSGGDHIVYVRDAEGCVSEALIQLDEPVKIDPIASVEYVCVNNGAGNSVTVTVDKSITDLSQLTYSLDGGPYQSSNIFNDIVPGVGHYIKVMHSNGCIKQTPLFDIDVVDQLALALSDGGLNEIIATATGGTGGYTYTFNGESTGTKNTYTISESGDYTVTVTDSSGCIATATRYFEFIDICIPNYFTPNGDNNLDTWAPGCAINYPNMVFKIFDRYGREVGSYRQGGAWDGKYNGRELPTGDYWYVVKLNDKDERDFVGHFTLYR